MHMACEFCGLGQFAPVGFSLTIMTREFAQFGTGSVYGSVSAFGYPVQYLVSIAVNTLYDINGMTGISLTISFAYSWPSSNPFGSSKPTVRICSMILSRSGLDQRCQLRGACRSPGFATNSECQESRKNERSGCPPQVSTLQPRSTSKSPSGLRVAITVSVLTSVEASRPKSFHSCAISVPAFVMMDRALPSTRILIVKGFPSGISHLPPSCLKPAFSSSSVAACGFGFHQPIPIERAIAAGSDGIAAP